MTNRSIIKGFLVLAGVAGVAGRGTLVVGAISSEQATAPRAVLAVERTPEEAIAEIQKLGGSFTRDEQNANKPVISVILRRTQATDAGLEQLRGLTQLRIDTFLKHLDSNGDGKIDAEEAKDPQNKIMMDRLFSLLGKEPHYPVVIAELKRDVEAYYRKRAARRCSRATQSGEC